MNNRILPFLALLIALGIFLGYINPTWTGTIAETNAAIAGDNQALAAASEYTARQKELIAARDAIDPANLAKLTILLPDSVDNVGLILDLNALAARSGFSLSNIDVSANTAGSSNASVPGMLSASNINPVSSIDLSLSAAGTYGEFQRFLNGVETSERLLDVKNLTIAGSNSGVYTYQMALRLYWLR